jgi:hypothetical protein
LFIVKDTTIIAKLPHFLRRITTNLEKLSAGMPILNRESARLPANVVN